MDDSNIFTEEETKKILLLGIAGNGGSCSTEKLEEFYNTCVEMKISGVLIELLLSGLIEVDITESATEPKFKSRDK